MQSAANAPSTGPGRSADQAVELGGVGQRLADPPHGGAVDVPGDLQLLRIVAGVRGEQAAVLLDVRLVVAPALAEVERGAQPRRHAAGALGESMNEALAWDDVRRVELDRGDHRDSS